MGSRQEPTCIPLVFIRATCPANFIIVNMLGEEQKLWSCSICNFLLPPVTSNLLNLYALLIVHCILTVRFLDAVKFTTLIPESLLISCKLSFAITGSKMASLSTLILKNKEKLNMVFVDFFISVLVARKNSPYKHKFHPLLRQEGHAVAQWLRHYATNRKWWIFNFT
jgi:hypothetical protein